MHCRTCSTLGSSKLDSVTVSLFVAALVSQIQITVRRPLHRYVVFVKSLPGSFSFEWLAVEKLVNVANQVYVLNILRSCAPDVFPQRQVLNSEQASQQMKISRVLILSPIPHSLPSLHLQFSHPQSSSLGRGSAQELRQQGRSETSRDDGCPAMLPTCGL